MNKDYISSVQGVGFLQIFKIFYSHKSIFIGLLIIFSGVAYSLKDKVTSTQMFTTDLTISKNVRNVEVTDFYINNMIDRLLSKYSWADIGNKDSQFDSTDAVQLLLKNDFASSDNKAYNFLSNKLLFDTFLHYLKIELRDNKVINNEQNYTRYFLGLVDDKDVRAEKKYRLNIKGEDIDRSILDARKIIDKVNQRTVDEIEYIFLEMINNMEAVRNQMSEELEEAKQNVISKYYDDKNKALFFLKEQHDIASIIEKSEQDINKQVIQYYTEKNKALFFLKEQYKIAKSLEIKNDLVPKELTSRIDEYQELLGAINPTNNKSLKKEFYNADGNIDQTVIEYSDPFTESSVIDFFKNQDENRNTNINKSLYSNLKQPFADYFSVFYTMGADTIEQMILNLENRVDNTPEEIGNYISLNDKKYVFKNLNEKGIAPFSETYVSNFFAHGSSNINRMILNLENRDDSKDDDVANYINVYEYTNRIDQIENPELIQTLKNSFYTSSIFKPNFEVVAIYDEPVYLINVFGLSTKVLFGLAVLMSIFAGLVIIFLKELLILKKKSVT